MAKRPRGRPRGPETTIVNLRIPTADLARLDRHIDRLTDQSGDLGINRSSIMREALAAWLDDQDAKAGYRQRHGDR